MVSALPARADAPSGDLLAVPRRVPSHLASRLDGAAYAETRDVTDAFAACSLEAIACEEALAARGRDAACGVHPRRADGEGQLSMTCTLQVLEPPPPGRWRWQRQEERPRRRRRRRPRTRRRWRGRASPRVRKRELPRAVPGAREERCPNPRAGVVLRVSRRVARAHAGRIRRRARRGDEGAGGRRRRHQRRAGRAEGGARRGGRRGGGFESGVINSGAREREREEGGVLSRRSCGRRYIPRGIFMDERETSLYKRVSPVTRDLRRRTRAEAERRAPLVRVFAARKKIFSRPRLARAPRHPRYKPRVTLLRANHR